MKSVRKRKAIMVSEETVTELGSSFLSSNDEDALSLSVELLLLL